ncbi:DC-STAMP domain-containing protein 2-like [Helicoverpa armigera]|uniref:DC-STAMP domain-containing protein 2-like n=1 Tax=Helicoverpa armigera TaxID=29058 RepID=UPI0030829F89
MAFFALLWKARTIEKYRLNYEKEKINSIMVGPTQMEQTLSQRWRHYRHDTKKRISRTFQKWYPEGSGVAKFFLYLRTDQTFPNFLLKSVLGFLGGIILTYLCFMFFVFQLSISLIHATIMSSIIGVLLTLGLAFSYRIRCLVFLLIPQFFSRVGRYTLTCYALVLILTGPATNTLKNSEVLSESMACSQEQIKNSVHQINDFMKRPFNALKDSLKLMVDRLKMITARVKETIIRIDRLVLSVVSVIHSSFAWLQSVTDICNENLGTPYERCHNAMAEGIADCEKTLGPDISQMCHVAYVAQAACYSVKPFAAFCYATDFVLDEAVLVGVRKKLKNFSEHMRAMFHVEVHMSHAYSFSSNTSRSASQVAAGIVTEIRNRADPLLTWLSWSSCVTSLFLLLIIFRAKYYQHMYETRSRFDNRYVTKELQELDLKRQRQGRETVLPLNRRERAKYITTTSFRLVASEKVYLNRSAVFMAITTFKLLIHMVADYSLYWVLMTIRYHGRYHTDMMRAHVTGTGFVARLFKSIIGVLDIPLKFTPPSPISCLPDPYPPDLRRYTQIVCVLTLLSLIPLGVLIFLLWFFALFEPYGLRLRHLIMGHYRPERAKARATWLYNHILRTRASFMKFARRKLHREYKYTSEASLTFRQWVTRRVPFQCLRCLLGLGPSEDHCLLCGTTASSSDPDSRLTKCETPGCPGTFCISCFTDIGELCTICLSPADYGDLSDVSFEKGSTDDDSDSDAGIYDDRHSLNAMYMSDSSHSTKSSSSEHNSRWHYFTRSGNKTGPFDAIALLHANKYERDIITNYFLKQYRTMKSNMKIRCWDKKYTLDWVTKHTSEILYEELEAEENYHSYSIEQIAEFDKVANRTKSVGVNTDRNRGVILNMLLNNFRTRKLKTSRNKKKKDKPNQKQYTKLSHTENVKRPNVKTHTHQVLEYNILNVHVKSLLTSKSLNGHNLAIRQRNLKSIVRGKKDTTRKDKQKVYEELKGVIKAIRQFLKCNDGNVESNQNNEVTPNNNPIEENLDATKPIDNTGIDEKNNKKKDSKKDSLKKPKKSKDLNKSKTKNSRYRIAAFHTFFSNHWNNFKCAIMPCTAQNRSDSPLSKEKKNHKRRKKRKDSIDLNETDVEECIARKDIKHTRNLRISAFLAEWEWTKRDYRKDKECEGNDDSFSLPMALQ